ncbi:ABC transporter ATP-binding protein/permease [Nocardia asteroides]|uniref:ABC transporter ATP-binding protein/permease n=1 Tax=Nocardia asteroides TaxID=1824 RepID=UPI0033F26F5B
MSVSTDGPAVESAVGSAGPAGDTAKASRRPIDPRLWRYARSARVHLVVSILLALVITATIVVIAILLGRVLAGVVTDPGKREFAAWTAELTGLAVAIVVRAAASWWQARLAHRAGGNVVAELESAVLRAGAELSPRALDARRTELAVVVGNGLSGLRGWFTGYLPALLLACLVPPIVLVVIGFHDPTSAMIAIITVPLIPVFMILIGLLTQGRAEATLAATTRLSDQLLDLFAGMPTLRALGREGSSGPSMVNQVQALGDSLRQRTMRALRIAFLSSMVLESLATLSVALIAVAIGLRLVYGEMTLYAGLVALILAPEVYWPLRQVGEKFHAAQDGMAAANKAFAVLDSVGPGARNRRAVLGHSADTTYARSVAGSPDAAPTGAARPNGVETPGKGLAATSAARPKDAGTPGKDLAATGAARRMAVGAPGKGLAGVGGDDGPLPIGSEITLRGLTVAARAGNAPDRLTAALAPGSVTVLTGPNGCGKSTTLQAILGLITPDAGAVLVEGSDVRDLDPDAWWSRIAWLPQRPVLVPGTLRENVDLLGAPATADLDEISAATGFDTVLAALPDGWHTPVGQGGLGLSLGQRQRLALTRVLASRRPILLLDEPTAHLDAAAEHQVLTTLRTLAHEGATVVVIGHRPAVLAAADTVVEVVGTSTSTSDPIPVDSAPATGADHANAGTGDSPNMSTPDDGDAAPSPCCAVATGAGGDEPKADSGTCCAAAGEHRGVAAGRGSAADGGQGVVS